MGGSPVTLANVYFPNKAHMTFCQQIIRDLQGFTSGCLIMGGNPLTDTSNGKLYSVQNT